MLTYRHITASRAIPLLALIICGSSAPLLAQTAEPLNPPVIHVQTRDLHLELPADQKRLNRRIASAVRMVCQDWQGLSDFAEYGRCTDHARKSAKTQRDELVERALQQDENEARSRLFFVPERQLTADDPRKLPSEDASR